jgi:hypothetical protein
VENWERQEERKGAYRKEKRSEQPSCGWKGGDGSGLAQGQELTGRKKTFLQEKKKRKKNILDTHWPSHGKTYLEARPRRLRQFHTL